MNGAHLLGLVGLAWFAFELGRASVMPIYEERAASYGRAVVAALMMVGAAFSLLRGA